MSQAHQRPARGAQPAGDGSTLPLSRAFVVRFRDVAEGTHSMFEGRLEHVLSGNSFRFDSEVELIQRLERALMGELRGRLSPGGEAPLSSSTEPEPTPSPSQER